MNDQNNAPERADRAAPEGQPVTLTYTNWRGETAERTITPKRIWFGSTDWHPEPQWLLTAFDAEKQADRDFALKDFGQALPPAVPTDNTALVEVLKDPPMVKHAIGRDTPDEDAWRELMVKAAAALASREAPPAAPTDSTALVEAACETLMNTPLEPSLAGHVRLVVESIRAALSPETDGGQ